ncbi:MAG: acyl carrier protein [Clostridiales bacterium]|nr:acyl carrier protein [Clostridiales bacterium]
MNTKDTVLTILQEVRPDIAFETETKLIDDGILDSFDIVSIVGDLNNEFEIEISVDELLPENFNTLQAITELVERMMQE